MYKYIQYTVYLYIWNTVIETRYDSLVLNNKSYFKPFFKKKGAITILQYFIMFSQ